MTFTFMISFLILAIFITITTEVEWFGWTTILTLIGIATIQCLHMFDIWFYFKMHVIQDIIYTIAYITIGIIWSFAKWFFFLINVRDERRELIKSAYSHELKSFMIIPQASNNKGKIIAWISYWPFSAIGTILNDPFRKLFNLIFSQFKNLYQRMADSIFKNDTIDLKIHIADLAEKEMQVARRNK